MQYEIFVDFSTRKLVFFCGTYPRASNKRRRELRALRRGYGEHFYKADSPDRFTKGFIKRSTNKLRNHTYTGRPCGQLRTVVIGLSIQNAKGTPSKLHRALNF